MSKYIRTKDGRIIDTTKIATGSKYMDFATNDESFRAIFETEPLSKSDTIEELCDEFVYIEYKKPRVLDKVITREIKEKGIKVAETIYCHPNWNGIIYGAIWTESGLKYVAKLVDGGELELL